MYLRNKLGISENQYSKQFSQESDHSITLHHKLLRFHHRLSINVKEYRVTHLPFHGDVNVNIMSGFLVLTGRNR